MKYSNKKPARIPLLRLVLSLLLALGTYLVTHQVAANQSLSYEFFSDYGSANDELIIHDIVESRRPAWQREQLPDFRGQIAQAQKFKSRRQVIKEVERKYDATVLKIRLDKEDQVYKVRILQSNGRVKNITVSAKG
ncbi:MAG: hypothetical protein AAF197_02865 [Pseudomonadota bacterium]